MRLMLSAAVALGVSLTPLVHAQSAPSAAELAAGVQKRYASVRDFTADFTQVYEGGVLRQKTTERGTVAVKKPGRMRWTYTAPEKKEFVSDGQKLYAYIPADRQVMVSDVPRGGGETTSALFLAGRGDITRDFTPALEGSAGNTYRLKLTPKRRQQDFEYLIVTVDKSSLRIVGLEALDQQGGRSAFTFTNFKENVGLADSRFVFKTPRGVQVVRAGG